MIGGWNGDEVTINQIDMLADGFFIVLLPIYVIIDVMMKLAMIRLLVSIVILLSSVGCASTPQSVMTPKEVEQWLVKHTGYKHPLFSCIQKAKVAQDYLVKHGYKAEVRESRKGHKLHAYVRYIGFDGQAGSILNNPGFEDSGELNTQ